MIKKIQHVALTVAMFIAAVHFFNPQKPVMAYLEYLPVYRVELRWDKEIEEQKQLTNHQPVMSQATQ